MIAVITQTIMRREIEPHREIFSNQVITKAILKLKSGLGIGLGEFAGGRMIKLYVTSCGGAGRMAWLVSGEQALLLLARPKNDPVGVNMSFKNQHFWTAAVARLQSVKADIASGAFEKIEI